jgi:hypothetical protein
MKVAPIPTNAEPRSPSGSSARLCADRGEDVLHLGRDDREHAKAAGRRDRRRVLKKPEPEPVDAIPAGMCARCGLIQGEDAPHVTPDVCIEALRDELAERG